jgi:hypothetical protein
MDTELRDQTHAVAHATGSGHRPVHRFATAAVIAVFGKRLFAELCAARREPAAHIPARPWPGFPPPAPDPA